MFDVNEILARLQNGEDAQKIADEMAATLNLANKTYEDRRPRKRLLRSRMRSRRRRIFR